MRDPLWIAQYSSWDFWWGQVAQPASGGHLGLRPSLCLRSPCLLAGGSRSGQCPPTLLPGLDLPLWALPSTARTEEARGSAGLSLLWAWPFPLLP